MSGFRISAATVLAVSLFLSAPAQAQDQLTAQGSLVDVGAQLVLGADQLVPAELNVVNNVAVLAFDRAVEIDMGTSASTLRPFVTLARLDPDGRALRLALRRGISIDQTITGNRIVLTLREVAEVSLPLVAEAEIVPEIVVPPQPPIVVTLSPVFRPEYRPPQQWTVEAIQDLEVLTIRVHGGNVDVDASLSTKFAVLTFPARSRINVSGINADRLSLMAEIELNDGRVFGEEVDEFGEPIENIAARQAQRLTLVGVDNTVTSHRREGNDLYVSFRLPPQAPMAEVEETDEIGAPTHLANATASAESGLDGHVNEATEEGPTYVAPTTHAVAEVVEENVVLTVEVIETADGIRLHFPWETETPATVFRRGGSLWMAFESDADLNIETLSRRFRGLFRNPEIIAARGMAILRIEIPNYVLATTAADGTSWLVTLGEAVVDPISPIEILRVPEHEESPRVLIELSDASNVHWVRDPDIGDTLALITAPAPVRGIVTPRQNVEFALLETAHGVAVESFVDDLHVTINEEVVDISRRQGLAMSHVSEQEIEMEIAELTRDTPGFMDFDAWSGGPDESFLQARYSLLADVTSSDEAGRDLARMNLVRFYLARGFNTEALGVLRYMMSENPTLAENPIFRALRGVTFIRMRRFAAGIQDLSSGSLQMDENAALWRGLARHKLGDDMGARREFSDGARMLTVYGPEEQARFRLAMAEVAYAAQDFAQMEDELDNVPHEGVPSYIPVHVELLRGFHAEGAGEGSDPALALEHYTHVIDSGYEPLVVRGMFHQTRLLAEHELINRDEAINRLEAQRYRWRGDDVELQVLQELGRQYVAGDHFREGLRTWGIAVSSFPGETRARAISDEMQDTFVSMFLGRDADHLSPIQAVGLFEEYRHLVPVGRQGDDMVRNLADRLVNVDLLAQAATLLSHQVENRLRGVGRAQVATRLAMVYLLDRRPAEALQAIRGTRQTLLPENLNRQRRVLEARALAALHRYEQALEVIENERREDANRLRTEIQWEAENWDDAASGFEELLGSAWRSDQALNDDQRMDVMRSAIGFIFAEDEVALTRLRTKYARHMAQSPDAEAFEIVTGRIETQGMAFREMARRIASIDTFDAFMQRMRGEFDMDEMDESAAIN